MRKLKLQVQISVDGYIADTNGKTDWLVWNWGNEWNWDDELKKYFNDLTESIDCVLLSRKMAEEGFIGHWARVAESAANDQASFARNITNAKKVVFSKTLDQSAPVVNTWENTTIANRDVINEIRALKDQRGKDMIAYGGASLVSSLIQARLVDEFYLFINPTVLGDGMPIFEDLDSKLNLIPAESKLYSCGVMVLKYVVKSANAVN
jgi:dihydrofolate reductase